MFATANLMHLVIFWSQLLLITQILLCMSVFVLYSLLELLDWLCQSLDFNAIKQDSKLLIYWSFIQTKFLGTARNNLDLVTKETNEDCRQKTKQNINIRNKLGKSHQTSCRWMSLVIICKIQTAVQILTCSLCNSPLNALLYVCM